MAPEHPSDSAHDGSSDSGWSRFRGGLLGLVAVTVVLFLSAILLSDGAEIARRLQALPTSVAIVILILPTLGFLVRFLRWDWYLRDLGHHVPKWHHLRIYLAGFALTATPGKAGENLRAVYLRWYGVPAGDTLAAFIAERIGDLVAILLLSVLAVRLTADHLWPIGLVVFVTLALVLALRSPRVAEILQRRSDNQKVIGRIWARIARSGAATRELLRPRLLIIGVLIASVAWGAEAVTFALVARSVEVPIPLVGALGVFALATLLGAISFLPGGVGPTEAVMVGLLVAAGGSGEQAIATTVVVRAVTLWWAILIGVITMATLKRSMAPTSE